MFYQTWQVSELPPLCSQSQYLPGIEVMAIPIVMLWKVRVPRRKKLAFMGLFSLTIITIAVAIARTADLGATAKASGQQDPSYLWMWSAIQSSLGKELVTKHIKIPYTYLCLSCCCLVSLCIPSTFCRICPRDKATVDADRHVLPATQMADARQISQIVRSSVRHLRRLNTRTGGRSHLVRKRAPGIEARDESAGCSLLCKPTSVLERYATEPNHAAARVSGREKSPAK